MRVVWQVILASVAIIERSFPVYVALAPPFPLTVAADTVDNRTDIQARRFSILDGFDDRKHRTNACIKRWRRNRWGAVGPFGYAFDTWAIWIADPSNLAQRRRNSAKH